MVQIPGTVPVAGKIAPTDTADQYPTHDSQYGQGGLMEVPDIATRDAISTQRRREGMMCYVASTQVTYQLVGGIANGNWTPVTTPAGMLEGVGNPNGTVTGYYGQSYRDTATDALYKSISNPSGTTWLVI
jgi:hypothetical protein